MSYHRFFGAACLLAVLIGAVGCGNDGPNRTLLARQTVDNYWSDIGHVKFDKAYDLLSPQNQQSVTRQDFRQNMFGFIENTNGVSAQAKHADVVGDCALVALDLRFPAATGGVLHAYQHLYWIDSGWRITEPNGQVTRTAHKLTTCPTGT